MYWQSLVVRSPVSGPPAAGFLFFQVTNPQWTAGTEEIPMATTLKNAQQRATMAAKDERARDAALAMQEYEAEKLAIGIKTARLRALRLAKEAESNERTKRKNPGTIPPVSFPKIISAHSDGAVRKIKRTKFSAHTADQDARQGCGARKARPHSRLVQGPIGTYGKGWRPHLTEAALAGDRRHDAGAAKQSGLGMVGRADFEHDVNVNLFPPHGLDPG